MGIDLPINGGPEARVPSEPALVHIGRLGEVSVAPLMLPEALVSPDGAVGLISGTVRALAELVADDETAIVWVHPQAPGEVEPQTRFDIIPGRIVLDTASHQLIVDGEKKEIAKKVFQLLSMFINNPGLALTRDQIVEMVWDSERVGIDNRTVDAHVKLLRQALGDARSQVVAVRGIGYRYDKWVASDDFDTVATAELIQPQANNDALVGSHQADGDLRNTAQELLNQYVLDHGSKATGLGSEYAVLEVLLSKPGAVVTHDQLHEVVYRIIGRPISGRAMRNIIISLRDKTQDKAHITALAGVGYRFDLVE